MMIAIAGVVFEGCPLEEVELAKKFWKSIDSSPQKKSSLSTNLLQDVRVTQNDSNIKKPATGFDKHGTMQAFLDEVERRKEKEEQEAFVTYEGTKNEAQNRLNRRRQERIQKEEISRNVLNDDLKISDDIYDWDEKIAIEREAREAMNEIDMFQRRLEQR